MFQDLYYLIAEDLKHLSYLKEIKEGALLLQIHDFGRVQVEMHH